MQKSRKNMYIGFCFHKEKIKDIDVINEEITSEQFYSDYILKRKPCIIKSQWMFNNRHKYIDINFMEKEFENIPVEIEHRVSNTFGISDKDVMKFHEFLSLIKEGETKYYLNTQHIDELKSKPLDLCNVVTKQFIQCLPAKLDLMGNLLLYQYNAWMGNNTDKKCKTILHHDSHDNVYYLLKGKKIFRLYSPNFALNLKTNGLVHKIFANGLIAYSPRIRCDSIDLTDVIKKSRGKLYNKINSLNERLRKLRLEELQYSSITDKKVLHDLEEQIKTVRKSLKEARDKWENMEDTSLNFKLKCLEFRRTKKRRIRKVNLPKHFCLINTEDRDSDSCIFDKEEDVKKRYIEVFLEEGDLLYLPCGWFHEVKSYSGDEGYHLAFNYWYYPPYIKKDDTGQLINRYKTPYVDTYIFNEQLRLYRQYGIIPTDAIEDNGTYVCN